MHANTITNLSRLLNLDANRTLDDLVRALKPARGRISELPKEKRLAFARGVLNALGLTAAELRP